MNDEERRIIGEFIGRVSGAVAPAQPAGASPWGGSVPATQARPPLPPVDPEADSFIANMFQQYPEARYRLTQTAFVQEAALVEAQNRIRHLEWERDQARQQAQQAQQQAQQAAQAAPRASGGFLGGMFGGGQRPAAPPPPPPQQQQYAPPPQPQYPPGYNPQAMAPQPQQQGPSFLGGALRTAAGVAGGLVVGNMLMNAFSGHHGSHDATAAAGGGLGGFGSAGALPTPPASPWSDPGSVAAAQGWDAGGGSKDVMYGDKFGSAQPAYTPDATPASWSGTDDRTTSYGSDESSGGSYGGGGGDYDGGGSDAGGGGDC